MFQISAPYPILPLSSLCLLESLEWKQHEQYLPRVESKFSKQVSCEVTQQFIHSAMIQSISYLL